MTCVECASHIDYQGTGPTPNFCPSETRGYSRCYRIFTSFRKWVHTRLRPVQWRRYRGTLPSWVPTVLADTAPLEILLSGGGSYPAVRALVLRSLRSDQPDHQLQALVALRELGRAGIIPSTRPLVDDRLRAISTPVRL